MIRYLFIHNIYDTHSTEVLERLRQDDRIKDKLIVRYFMELRGMFHFRGCPSVCIIDDSKPLNDENIIAMFFDEEIVVEDILAKTHLDEPKTDIQLLQEQIDTLALAVLEMKGV